MGENREEFKTLATCKPSEFMEQAYRIARNVEDWLDVTEIKKIVERTPEKEFPKAGMTTDEKVEIERRNKEALQKQQKENLHAILESVMKTHSKETLDVLALLCFIDPAKVDDYPMEMYLKAFNDLANNENVINFFITFTRLGQVISAKA